MPTLRCHHCRAAVPEALFNTATSLACPNCQTSLLVRVFPAFFRTPEAGAAAEALGSSEEAGCFYHPRKKAVVPCANCGRFLCALCDLEIDQRHVCPACASGGAGAGVSGEGRGLSAGKLESPRLLHDSIALSLATLPLVFFPLLLLSLIASPIALFLVVRYWNEPRQHPLGRTRARLVLAGLLASATLAGWGFLFYASWQNQL